MGRPPQRVRFGLFDSVATMNLTNRLFQESAGELRSTEALLTSAIHQIRDSRLWVGGDADRFFDEWDSDVRARLLGAAGKLEHLTLVHFP